MPEQRQFSTYEQVAALTKKWYGTIESMAEMAERAILDRGGHCLSCACKAKLTARNPHTNMSSIRSENLLVQVRCTIDPFRKYPFRDKDVTAEECPSYKHHIRQQLKLEIPIR